MPGTNKNSSYYDEEEKKNQQTVPQNGTPDENTVVTPTPTTPTTTTTDTYLKRRQEISDKYAKQAAGYDKILADIQAELDQQKGKRRKEERLQALQATLDGITDFARVMNDIDTLNHYVPYTAPKYTLSDKSRERAEKLKAAHDKDRALLMNYYQNILGKGENAAARGAAALRDLDKAHDADIKWRLGFEQKERLAREAAANRAKEKEEERKEKENERQWKAEENQKNRDNATHNAYIRHSNSGRGGGGNSKSDYIYIDEDDYIEIPKAQGATKKKAIVASIPSGKIQIYRALMPKANDDDIINAYLMDSSVSDDDRQNFITKAKYIAAQQPKAPQAPAKPTSKGTGYGTPQANKNSGKGRGY